MTPEEYLLLNEHISGRFGISFSESRQQVLEIRLRPRLKALRLRSFRDYYLHLQCDTNGESQNLAEAVTNNETYFFREPDLLEDLLAAAPELAGRGGTLRVLSAGCSSGDEPYTLAILAQTPAAQRRGVRLDVQAIDIDHSRLALARQAEYGRSSLRLLQPEEIDRYFTAAGPGRWSLKPRFRSGIRFASGNLIDLSTLPVAGTFDAVLCRNVLIYFSEDAVRRTIHNFAALLRLGGLLALGVTESIIGLSSRFETVRLGRGIVYRRTGS
jgi:chemotaxis protein methyltransferase CheR